MKSSPAVRTEERECADGELGSPSRQRVLLVTGMSGAGKTSALKALEDLGYEAIDHVPLSMLSRLVAPRSGDAAVLDRPVAIGVDVRTREFGIEPFLDEVDRLIKSCNADVKLLFLDCDDEELRRRYTETRHRHPLAVDRPVADGIARERLMMVALRRRADVVIDTTGLAVGALKRTISGYFDPDNEASLVVFVSSFSFARGLPREADLVFDVRFLANPYYRAELRELTGRDEAVAAFISADDGFEPFISGLTAWLGPLLPRYAAEGKCYLTIAVGCTGGRHRSVLVAERLASWLTQLGRVVHVHHRDLDRSKG
jgi:UPF0042 nucleotide-binding protein